MVSLEVFHSVQSLRGRSGIVSSLSRHDGDGKKRRDPVVRIPFSREFLDPFVEIA